MLLGADTWMCRATVLLGADTWMCRATVLWAINGMVGCGGL